MAGSDDDEVARLVRKLTGTPATLSEMTPPARPGLYAWWVTIGHLSDASPAIPPVLVGAAGWSLLYVGIAPSSSSSNRNLALRIGHDHRRGNIGGSTFRQSLAALLRGRLGLEPMAGSDRSRLVDETPLTSWMQTHCGLTFVATVEPWRYEEAVIARLDPPLNIVHGAHPFRAEVEAARVALRRDCALL
jgi:hypothetical protein